MSHQYFISPFTIPENIRILVDSFLENYIPIETSQGNKALLLKDEKSEAFYIPCHLKASDFVGKTDFNATIDGSDEDELYKLNRDITENQIAFSAMISDAQSGRSFEDIVVEFDRSYNPETPLKIYGGQHRIKAISAAITLKPDTPHGFRVYFGLTKEQKVEIATINNTSITVSNDLLDRMKEQLMGSELRQYCQQAGLLNQNEDFADKRDANIPTVRVARTFVVNYWKGKSETALPFHQPIVCKSGGIDEDYFKLRETINWNDADFIEAGKQFASLHKTQKLKVLGRKRDNYNEFARKAFSLTVVASWAYAVGFYSSQKTKRAIIYSLTNNLGLEEDPLNAKALSEARLKGIDPDTYRGLGTRSSSDELGRMLEVFLVLVDKATEKKISTKLANAAIQSYEAKKATYNAEKTLAKI